MLLQDGPQSLNSNCYRDNVEFEGKKGVYISSYNKYSFLFRYRPPYFLQMRLTSETLNSLDICFLSLGLRRQNIAKNVPT